jgi:nucleotide-binding universal stress UspA family protein
MKKILVGFDGSEGAEQALNRALMLLDDYGDLIIFAVIPSPSSKTFVDEDIYKSLKIKAESMIKDAIKALGHQSFNIKAIVEEGDPAIKIIDTSNSLNVDLIVLGSRGQSKLGQYLIGSVANKVVQYAHKPVMVVR